MTELAITREVGSTLAIRAEQQSFSREQIEALKKMNGWEEVPDAELAVFFHQAQRTGLDPFAKQIYLIGRYSRKKNRTEYTIQTGIDGLRLIADRTGRYAGSDAPTFHEDDYGLFAKVTVWKFVGALEAGIRTPFSAIAYEREYLDERSPMHQRMPRTMLAKTCEALALRKAFPADLSGIYTHEEMRQAGPSGANEQVTEIETEISNGGSSGASGPGPWHQEVLEEIDELLTRFPEDHFDDAKRDTVRRYARASVEQARASRQKLRRLLDEMDGGEAGQDPSDLESAPREHSKILAALANEVYAGKSDRLSGSEWLQREIAKPFSELSKAEAEELIEKLNREGGDAR